MTQRIHFQLLTLAVVLVFAACQKDLTRVYDVNRQQIALTNINKEAMKRDLEFISNAHADLFGKPIEGYFLTQTINDLASSNDKQLVADLVLRQMLNRSDLPAPTDAEMRADLDGFVHQVYKKFLHREANPFEAFKLKQLIENDPNLSPVMVFYAFLTCDEYQFF